MLRRFAIPGLAAHAGGAVPGDTTMEILSVYLVDTGKPLREPAP